MKKRVIYELTEKDIELLRHIPDNPCTKCSAGMACCGCAEGNRYNLAMKAYKDAQLEEFVSVVKQREKLVQDVQKAYNALKNFDKVNKEPLDVLRKNNFPLDNAKWNQK